MSPVFAQNASTENRSSVQGRYVCRPTTNRSPEKRTKYFGHVENLPFQYSCHKISTISRFTPFCLVALPQCSTLVDTIRIRRPSEMVAVLGSTECELLELRRHESISMYNIGKKSPKIATFSILPFQCSVESTGPSKVGIIFLTV